MGEHWKFGWKALLMRQMKQQPSSSVGGRFSPLALVSPTFETPSRKNCTVCKQCTLQIASICITLTFCKDAPSVATNRRAAGDGEAPKVVHVNLSLLVIARIL